MYTEGPDVLPVSLSEYRTLNADDANGTGFYTAVYKAIQTCNIGLYFNDKTAEASTLEIRREIKIPESILLFPDGAEFWWCCYSK